MQTPFLQTSQCLERLPSSYIREILKAATAPDCISLAGGLPSEHLFPFADMRKVFADLCDNLPANQSLFQYGATAGYQPLINLLRDRYELPEVSHQVLITNGSQQGIDLVARGYLEPGSRVVMEVPAYLGAIQAFSLTGAEMCGVEQTADGPDLEQLTTLFASGRCRVFYAVPDFHNPTGRSWSLSVRKAVAKLCIDHNVLLLEDAPYRDLRFDGEHLPLVASLCPTQAIVARSFSKTSLPGLRLGMLSGPRHLLEPLERIKQAVDLHSQTLGQFMLYKLLSLSSYPQHLASLCEVYGARYRVLSRALENEMEEFSHFNSVDGGMFIWLELDGIDGDHLARVALEQKVAVVPGSVFFLKNGKRRQALRLNFSHAEDNQLLQAVERLACACKSIKHAASHN